MTTPDLTPAQLEQLLLRADVAASAQDDEAQRRRLQRAARQFQARLQTPWERIEQQAFVEPMYIAAVKTGMELGLFDKWLAAGDGPMTPAELAALTGCDPVLMGRLLRFLVAFHALAEASNDTHYLQTDLSRALARPENKATYNITFDVFLPTARAIPSFLARNNYANPHSGTDTATGAAVPACAGKHFFAYLAEDAARLRDFGLCMTAYTGARPAWPAIFPVAKHVEASAQGPFVVDVGGGFGQDLRRLRAALGDVECGTLILQDQPDVVASVPADAPFEARTHDFFTPQPITGAKFYYMHSVLHDWPDAQARTILAHTAAAMARGHSRLLVHDHVVPERGAWPLTMGYDFLMMAVGGATERTLAMWHALLEGTGLRVVKVWALPENTDSVLEIERV